MILTFGREDGSLINFSALYLSHPTPGGCRSPSPSAPRGGPPPPRELEEEEQQQQPSENNQCSGKTVSAANGEISAAASPASTTARATLNDANIGFQENAHNISHD